MLGQSARVESCNDVCSLTTCTASGVHQEECIYKSQSLISQLTFLFFTSVQNLWQRHEPEIGFVLPSQPTFRFSAVI